LKVSPTSAPRLLIEHQNDGATMPLLLPVAVICNTTDDQLLANIKQNSMANGKWLKMVDAHDRVAVLCGSGPSLSDTLDDIKVRAANGEVIFALNAAAGFLGANGVMPDYQAVADARDATAELIGPAKEHLLASQCSPLCFAKAPGATLWHMIIDDIDDVLPEYDDDYCLVGGGTSIGCTALFLAYAMGYRKFALYGYDTSYRGDAHHVVEQRLNDEEAVVTIPYNGTDYTVSLTMRGQCKAFFAVAHVMKGMGCEIELFGDGLLPAMWRGGAQTMTENQKYETIWSLPEYRLWSPGEDVVDEFFNIVKPTGLVLDFGCGTGRAAAKINEKGCEVILIDFAANCLDHECRHLPFYTMDLTKPMPFRAAYGFCTDVMEHIPPEHVNDVITNIMDSAKTVFFQISTVPDAFGKAINDRLHLSVHDHASWAERFAYLGYTITYDEDRGNASLFVVSRTEN
jgi:hypothetical protein